jgi:transcriptional regulator with XRE-family HTH domain
MYPNLKLQIFKRGDHQNHLARALGINETMLSKIIHGYREPTEAQKKLLASYLDADEAWLFEKYSEAHNGMVPEQNRPPSEKANGRDGNG